MSRVAGVVRWHHRTYTGALDEGPAMVGLEIVIGLAQRCQLVEAGMPGRAVLEAFDATGYKGYLTFEYFHPYLHWPEALIYQTADSLDRMLGLKG